MVVSALLSASLVACGGGSASDASSSQGTAATGTADGVGAVSLAVSGGSDLPLNGTTTQVTVGLTPEVPTRVELSRDNFTPFATWPNGSFFTRSADGKTLSGTWCITSSCWSNTPGAHVLKVVATYADGTKASSSVALNVDDAAATAAAPTTAPPAAAVSVPSGVSWTGLSAAMWSEINSQRAAFGDPNDCKARVDAVPTTGTTINPGADINAALASSNVVILAGGTYNLSSPVNVPAGKKLVGAPGQTVTLNAVGADRGVQLGNGATLANVIVDGAATFGVLPFSSAGYSNNTLIYQVSVRKTGFYSSTSDGSIGIFISGGAANNCVVSSEALDSWNAIGSDGSTTSVTAHGGNSDGIDLSNGAHDNTLIDFHSLRNGDDGIDMWNGGVAFMYFSTANDNGKTTGKALTGDGNGIKLGIGSVAHKLYKTTASNNKSHGFNLNANTMQPVLVLSTASANGDTDYGNGVTPP